MDAKASRTPLAHPHQKAHLSQRKVCFLGLLACPPRHPVCLYPQRHQSQQVLANVRRCYVCQLICMMLVYHLELENQRAGKERFLSSRNLEMEAVSSTQTERRAERAEHRAETQVRAGQEPASSRRTSPLRTILQALQRAEPAHPEQATRAAVGCK